jgi:GT2 family glycosyltransferase
MPAASILTVTYNSSLTIERCLLSLNNQSFKDFEVLVVDNDSKDKTTDVIESIRPHLNFNLTLFSSHENLGFAAGNNFLLSHAQGKYIALINPDAFAQPEWLENLITTQTHNPDVGICASKLLRSDSDKIDSAGDSFSTVLKAFKRGEGRKNHLYGKSGRVFGACAGAALYRREMLDKIGFFDEEFFLIHEDTDLSFRANLAGWKVIYIADAIVYHKVHASIGKMSDIQIYHTLRNSEFVRIKNISMKTFLRHFPAFLIGVLVEFIYFVLLHRNAKTYLRAKRDALKKLPLMLEKRKALAPYRKVGKTEEVELTPIWNHEFFFSKLKRLFLN